MLMRIRLGIRGKARKIFRESGVYGGNLFPFARSIVVMGLLIHSHIIIVLGVCINL